MISYLSGIVKDYREGSVTLISNEIGFCVSVPTGYKFELGQKTSLEIHSHFNQEQGQQLFGFKSRDERVIFSLILSCSGIGPKIGLSVLNSISPSIFLSAIERADIDTLNSIDGIGKKKAEYIILHLKDRVSNILLTNTKQPADITYDTIRKLNTALNSLGYKQNEISSVIINLKKSDLLKDSTNFDIILRKSLSLISKMTK